MTNLSSGKCLSDAAGLLFGVAEAEKQARDHQLSRHSVSEIVAIECVVHDLVNLFEIDVDPTEHIVASDKIIFTAFSVLASSITSMAVGCSLPAKTCRSFCYFPARLLLHLGEVAVRDPGAIVRAISFILSRFYRRGSGCAGLSRSFCRSKNSKIEGRLLPKVWPWLTEGVSR